jgi:hypothetical protein
MSSATLPVLLRHPLAPAHCLRHGAAARRDSAVPLRLPAALRVQRLNAASASMFAFQWLHGGIYRVLGGLASTGPSEARYGPRFRITLILEALPMFVRARVFTSECFCLFSWLAPVVLPLPLLLLLPFAFPFATAGLAFNYAALPLPVPSPPPLAPAVSFTSVSNLASALAILNLCL